MEYGFETPKIYDKVFSNLDATEPSKTILIENIGTYV